MRNEACRKCSSGTSSRRSETHRFWEELIERLELGVDA